jgi:hypothetical protein
VLKILKKVYPDHHWPEKETHPLQIALQKYVCKVDDDIILNNIFRVAEEIFPTGIIQNHVLEKSTIELNISKK